MKKFFNKNIVLIIIPILILAGIAYITSRPGGYIREEREEIETEWTAQNMYDLNTLENVNMSKDSDFAIYTTLGIGLSEERLEKNTIARNTETGEEYLLFEGSKSLVRYGIDRETNRIAYSVVEDGKEQVYLGDFDSGRILNSEKITNSKNGVLHWMWDREGERVAYIENESYISGDDPYVLGEINPTDLYISELSKEDIQLTDSNIIIKSMDWSSDGDSIAYEYYGLDNGEKLKYDESEKSLDTKIREVDIVTRTPIDIEINKKGNSNPVYSLDGKYIAYTSEQDMNLGIMGIRDIKLFDRSSGTVRTMGTTKNGRPVLVEWGDESSLYVSDKDGLVNKLYELSVEGGDFKEILESNSEYPDYNVEGQDIYFVDESTDSPQEGYRYSMSEESLESITEENSKLGEKNSFEREVVEWESADGLVLEGILAYPKDYSSDEEYDLIVDMHYGVSTSFMLNYMDPVAEAYPLNVFLENSFVVFRPNVRGSDAYGPEYRQAAIGDFGINIAGDLATGIGSIEDKINIGRTGVVSWGYGSYNTAMAISKTDVFNFAVMGGLISDMDNFIHTTNGERLSDIYFKREDTGEFEDISPIDFVGDVNIPVLLIHGAEDRFAPYTQSILYYNKLKENDVEASIRIYPKSGHIIDDMNSKIDYMENIIEWSNEIR